MCRVVHSFIHSLIKWQPSQLTPHGVNQCGELWGGDVAWSSRVLSVLVSPGCVAQLFGQFVAGNIIFIAFAFGAFIIFQQVPKINFIFIQWRRKSECTMDTNVFTILALHSQLLLFGYVTILTLRLRLLLHCPISIPCEALVKRSRRVLHLVT